MRPGFEAIIGLRAVLVVIAAALSLLAPAAAANAQGAGHVHDARPGAKPAPYAALSPFRCDGTTLACATAATPAWGPDGSLWLAWAANGAVSVARSDDGGRWFSAPVVVGRHGDRLDIGPDARPQLLVTREQRVIVAYGVFVDDHWNATVLVSSSFDGKVFSAPTPIATDSPSQRFPTLAIGSDGAVFAAWIDKRGVAAAAREGRRLKGAAVAYAWSRDGGRSFDRSRLAADASCECCRIALAVPAGGDPALVYRAVFDQKVRDHALLRFGAPDQPGPVRRVAVDDWETDACPHHGPALALDAEGGQHVAWYTQGRVRKGVFYARSDDEGASFSTPVRVGAQGRRAGRPALLAQGATVWLSWKEFDGEVTTVRAQWSRDRGSTWSEPREIATTRGHSDHPLLTANDGKVYLSWLAHDDGYRLIALETQ